MRYDVDRNVVMGRMTVQRCPPNRAAKPHGSMSDLQDSEDFALTVFNSTEFAFKITHVPCSKTGHSIHPSNWTTTNYNNTTIK